MLGEGAQRLVYEGGQAQYSSRLVLTILLGLLLAAPRCDLPLDADGKVIRSSRAKSAFRATHPCPSTGETTAPCPGYSGSSAGTRSDIRSRPTS